MKNKLVSTALLAQFAAFAADCPATLQPAGYGAMDRQSKIEYQLKVKVTNSTSQLIQGIQLGGVYRDSVEDEKPFLQGFTLTSIKPGAVKGDLFDTGVPVGTDYKNAKLWIKKALFADGTKWEDDGTHACSADGFRRLTGNVGGWLGRLPAAR
ncbi:MAG: hypothetical protein M3Y72_15965 [Acidobacteriota bacterium]|nr:hypothetical protein [Acidobacteriota bacterium]